MRYSSCIAALLTGCALAVAARAEHPFRIYWTDAHDVTQMPNGTIDRAIPDGSEQEVVLLFPTFSPKGLAFDVPRRKMYWTVEDTKQIMRANLDGTDVELLWEPDDPFFFTPEDIAIDSAGGKMYWADQSTDSIRRANLDGTEVEDLICIEPPQGELSAVFGIDLDLTNGKVYWTDWRLEKVQRANLDGSDVEDLITDITKPISIALDVAGGKMYLALHNFRIKRANLDGSDLDTLVSDPLLRSVTLDLPAGKMYWVTVSTVPVPGIGTVRRANLDGSEIETIIPSGLDWPRFVDILPVEVSLADYALFLDCVTGPGVPSIDPDCAPLDYDDDGDIDFADFSQLQIAFTGPF